MDRSSLHNSSTYTIQTRDSDSLDTFSVCSINSHHSYIDLHTGVKHRSSRTYHRNRRLCSCKLRKRCSCKLRKRCRNFYKQLRFNRANGREEEPYVIGFKSPAGPIYRPLQHYSVRESKIK
ncbi:hypothetical protein M8J76_001274 [Diaphorina citri]|nr:hypothetical protein M8J76_001274 [Diaphorina citri]